MTSTSFLLCLLRKGRSTLCAAYYPKITCRSACCICMLHSVEEALLHKALEGGILISLVSQPAREPCKDIARRLVESYALECSIKV